MANQNIQRRSIIATTGAASVDLAVLTDPGFGVEVTNVTGTSPLWFTVDVPGGACAVPTINGENCFCAASVAGTTVNVRVPNKFGTVVQLISAAPTTYQVTVVGNQVSA